eukprot:24171-Prorocentrum_minimum.AAC.1
MGANHRGEESLFLNRNTGDHPPDHVQPLRTVPLNLQSVVGAEALFGVFTPPNDFPRLRFVTLVNSVLDACAPHVPYNTPRSSLKFSPTAHRSKP